MAKEKDPREQVENPEVAHEMSDINVRGVLLFAVALIVVGVIVHLSLVGLLRYFNITETDTRQETTLLSRPTGDVLPPEPRIQARPAEDLKMLQQEEDQVLKTYGWVDRNAGTVRIPIDEAMKLTLKRGLPVRQQGQAPQTGNAASSASSR